MGKPLKIRIGERIKDILIDLQMSQGVLAKKSNIHPTYISEIIHGSANLTLDTISKIEKALSTKLIDLTKR
jgi:plasmid maintenance system antidote protein VapI